MAFPRDGVHLNNAADYGAIRQYVEIVATPLSPDQKKGPPGGMPSAEQKSGNAGPAY
jgi:hypothetical protein